MLAVLNRCSRASRTTEQMTKLASDTLVNQVIYTCPVAMPRTLLLTAGTSIANGTAALRSYQARASAWDAAAAELQQQIRERLQTFDLTSESGRVRASAELNILHRLPVNADDEVVLFTTDTADGRCCAEELRRVIESDLGVVKVKVERVQGLQVRDATMLRSTGLANLSRLLISYLDDPQRQYSGGCVLCPNGGFKGVVPFMAVLGMIFRAPVVYVFEFAETVISLPPLPIGFAADLFDRAFPAMNWASEEVVFDVNEFYRRIPGFNPNEAPLFDSFLEITPDADGNRLASLTPLASVLAEREQGGAPLRLSETALRDLTNLSSAERREVEPYLFKLKSALWRSQHRGITKKTSNLEFYPRGNTTTWRFGGFTDSGVFHLCWFAQHNTYDRLIPQRDRQRGAFPVDGFTDYTPVDESNIQSDVGDPYHSLTWFDLRAEIEELNARNELLATKETVAVQNTNRMQKLLHESRRTIDELTSAKRALQDRLQQLEQQQESDDSSASVPME